MLPSDFDDSGIFPLYVFICFSGMLLLTQGIALFYAGLTPFGSALIQCAYSIIALTVCSLQSFAIGFSFVGSQSSGWLDYIIGGFHDALLLGAPEDSIALTRYLGRFILTTGFAVVTSSLMLGTINQRGKLIPSMVFLVIWLSIVYDPIAHWCWNKSGWAFRIGVLDYAGGTAVHCTAGVSALIYSYKLGPRSHNQLISGQPMSLLTTVTGTFFMWLGWFGFNCAAATRPGVELLRVMVNTQLSASAGAITWLLVDYSFDSEWSIVGFCSGIISGLVCVTPGAAYIPIWSSLVFGVVGGLVCNFGTKLKFQLRIDDCLDVFAVHGLGGLSGSILTGVFAKSSYLDVPVKSMPKQVMIQIISAFAILLWAGGATFVILTCMSEVFGFRLKIEEDRESMGLDLAEHGEVAYCFPKSSHQDHNSADTLWQESGQGRVRSTNQNISMFPTPGQNLLLNSRQAKLYGTSR